MYKKVLIIGFGKMGHIHSKYLFEFDIPWDYYDPFVGGGVDKLDNLDGYSHIIISTPPENHYDMYVCVRHLGFAGNVYIDKPVVIDSKYLDIFKDEKLFCGMTERYNPSVVTLKRLIDIEKLTSIKFSRYSTVPDNMVVPVLFDLGIHDLDLYLYLTEFSCFPKHYDVFEKDKTCYILANHNGVLSILEWSHESHRRERKITVLQKDIVYEADLIDQTVVSYEAGNVRRNLYVDKEQSIKRIISSFLNDERCDARLSHEFMFDIIENKTDKNNISD